MAMSLDSILNELKGAPAAEKTAAEKVEAPSKVAQAKTDLLDALKRAETSTQKTAAEAAPAAKPADELQKIASDLAAADQEALVKEAHFYGAAICDGFMSRMKQYEGAAADLPATKTAGAADVEKIAEEAIRGYVDTQNRIKVAAEAEYQRGYADTMAQVEKVASDVFSVGARDCEVVLQSFGR